MKKMCEDCWRWREDRSRGGFCDREPRGAVHQNIGFHVAVSKSADEEKEVSIVKEVIVCLFAKEREAKKEIVAREEEENKDMDNEEKGAWLNVAFDYPEIPKELSSRREQIGINYIV